MSDNGKGPKARDLTLYGVSDTELLAMVEDLADENGWCSSLDVRLQLGEDIEEIRHSGVGTRLSWMRRYGWLERSEETGLWRLTAMGIAILDHPEFSASLTKALATLNPAQRVHLAREISESGASSAWELKTALRREWQRNMSTPRPR